MAQSDYSTKQTDCNKEVSHISENLALSRVIFDTPLLKPLWFGAHLGGDVVAMGNVQQIYQPAH
jgi:hypothetical protein